MRSSRIAAPGPGIAAIAVLVAGGGLAGCGAAAAAQDQVFEQPAVSAAAAELDIDAAATAVTIRSEPITELYRVDVVHGDGTVPDVRLDRATQAVAVTATPGGAGSTEIAAVEVVVNEQVPWRIRVSRPAHNLDLELERIHLIGLEVGGDADSLLARLPVPQDGLPVTLTGSIRTVGLTLQYSPVQLRLDGGAGELNFLRSDQGRVGAGSVRTGDGDYANTRTRYDIHLSATAATVILSHD